MGDTDDLRCPRCASRLHNLTGSSTTTLMGFSSHIGGDDALHSHDPNWRATSLECRRGHRFLLRSQDRCPVAGCEYGPHELREQVVGDG